MIVNVSSYYVKCRPKTSKVSFSKATWNITFLKRYKSRHHWKTTDGGGSGSMLSVYGISIYCMYTIQGLGQGKENRLIFFYGIYCGNRILLLC